MSEPNNYFKIIKVPSVVADKIQEYIGNITYQTYSVRTRKMVTRNTFTILSVEPVHDGTLFHLQVFGRNKDKKYLEFKKFIEELEKRLLERLNAANSISV